MKLTYKPGRWNAVISDQRVIILDGSVPTEALPTLFSEIGKSDPLALVLDELVSQHGMSFGNLPNFLILAREEHGVRVVIRGVPTITIHTPSGIETLSGDGSPTWVERTVPDVSALTIEFGEPASGTDLPITGGVINVAALSLGNQPAISADTASAPASETSPAPEPEVPQASLETLLPATEEGTEPPEELPTETRVDDDSYDELLFGETRISSTEDAAIRNLQDDEAEAETAANEQTPMILGIPTPSPVPAPQAPDAATPPQGDHDGQTISIEQLAALQQQLGMNPPGTAGTTQVPGTGQIAGKATPILIVSTGERVTLDRSVVVGRRPQSVRSAGSLPHLVTVPSPSQDISRSHLEIRIESGSVIATDLDTTNGTRLLRLGKEPMRLQPGQSTLLVPGDQLDLGDNINLSFEGLS